MSGARGFRYSLQPLLLTRRWEMESLMIELGEHNAALAETAAAIAGLRERMAAASADWRQQQGAGVVLQMTQMSMFTRFMGELNERCAGYEALQARQVMARDALVDRVAGSQRALEAIEDHRDDEREGFSRHRQQGELRLADDQWNTLRQRDVNEGD